MSRSRDLETEQMRRLWDQLPYAEQLMMTMLAKFLVKRSAS